MIKESNMTLKNIEHHLKNLNLTLQNMPVANISYRSSPPLPSGSHVPGIERIKRPSKPTMIQSQTSSSNLMVIKEIKTIFKQNVEENSIFNVKEILKPLTEGELKKLMLDDETLKKKEEKAIENQIKRIRNLKKKELRLEDLKKPE